MILSSQAAGLKRGGPTSEVQLHGNLTGKVSEISDVNIKVVSHQDGLSQGSLGAHLQVKGMLWFMLKT